MDIKTYLEQEKRGSGRYELHDKIMREMPTDDDNHFAIRLNCAFVLKEYLSSQDAECRIYVGDMKVYLPLAEAFFYPDILMTCTSEDAQQNDYKQAPRLLVEVATDASSGFDRGRKFACYRQFESLQAYIIVDATYPAVDCFFRQNGDWMLYPFSAGQTLQIPTLDFECEVDDIYQDIFAE